MSKPTYLYKLVPQELIILPVPDVLPLSPLDTNDGFIHLSTAKQLPGTLARFFANEVKIHILRIKYDDVENDIRWEDPKGKEPGVMGEDNVFPHLYNGQKLGSAEVENVFVLQKDGVSWDTETIKNSSWLISSTRA